MEPVSTFLAYPRLCKPLKQCIVNLQVLLADDEETTAHLTPRHVADIFSRLSTGRKGPYAAYYVQIEPNGGSFVGKSYSLAVALFQTQTLAYP